MNKLKTKHIIELNQRLGGSLPDNFNKQRLDNILPLPYKRDAYNEYIYRGASAKAAKLACELYKQKCFSKKNLSTALFAGIILLKVNGGKIRDYQQDINFLVEYIRHDDFEKAEAWIRQHYYDKYSAFSG